MRQRLALLLILLAAPLMAAAELNASVDRTSLSINETLTLTIFTNTQVNTQSLDISVLAQDFEILRTSPQSSLSIINNRQTAETRWVITLLPRRQGTFTIPSFSLGSESTAPIQIEVTAASHQVGETPLAAELVVNSDEVFVNQELRITIRLFSSPSVSNLSGGQLQVQNADVSLLGTRNFTRVVAGETWQVNEWTYALYARNPGRIDIPVQSFSGVLGSASRSLLDPFGSSGRRILARTELRTIEVLPPPSGTANWLPARELSLAAEWSGDPNRLRVGDPMTRTIVISALGQQAAALPPLHTLATADYKVYDDQPSLEERPSAGGLRAERRDSAAIVPARAGEIRFPEIRLPWWDVETGTWQEAVLPAETIQVAPALLADDSSTPSQPEISAEPESADAELLTATEQQPAGDDPVSWTTWLVLAICALLLADNWRLRKRGRLNPTEAPSESRAQVSATARWQALMSAVDKGSPLTIRNALLKWADSQWRHAAPHNLQRLRERVQPELAGLLTALEASYSRPDAPPPDREKLRQALRTWKRDQDTPGKESSSPLPELYPR